MTLPLVSVIIPVYNGEKFVRSAILSILSQAVKDIEVIVIDDCSIDNSRDIIRSIKDPRLCAWRNPTNQGVSRSRNDGIAHAKGEFIAFLDYDDVALPNRLECQVDYFRQHPRCVVLGGLAQAMDADGCLMKTILGKPLMAKDVAPSLLFKNNFVLSSMMFRKDVLKGYEFNHTLEPAEDYDLITRLSRDRECAILKTITTQYRLHEQGVSVTKAAKMEASVKVIVERQLHLLGVEASAEEYAIHQSIANRSLKTIHDLEGIHAWLLNLLERHAQSDVYDANAFKQIIQSYWYDCCLDAFSGGLKTWRLYWRSPLAVRSVNHFFKNLFLLRHTLPALFKS